MMKTLLATRVADRLVALLREDQDPDFRAYVQNVRPGRLRDLMGHFGHSQVEIAVLLLRWLDRPQTSDYQMVFWVALLVPAVDDPEASDWQESRTLGHIESLIQDEGKSLVTVGETRYAFSVVDTQPQNPHLTDPAAGLGLEGPSHAVYPLSVIITAHHHHTLEELAP